MVNWLRRDTSLGRKSQADIDAFNADRMHWHPDPGSHSEQYFKQLRDTVAPGRPEIVTWFDCWTWTGKGRPVDRPTTLA